MSVLLVLSQESVDTETWVFAILEGKGTVSMGIGQTSTYLQCMCVLRSPSRTGRLLKTKENKFKTKEVARQENPVQVYRCNRIYYKILSPITIATTAA